MKTLVIIMLATLLLSALGAADDVEVMLDGTSSTNAFTVKDNAATPNILLKVGGDGNVKLQGNKYLNFGASEGTDGYGFRDNNGTLEYKNSAGVWTPWTTGSTSPYGYSSSSYTYGQIAYDHGDYDTTQPSVEIGSLTAYETMLPVILGSGGGTPWSVTANGGVEIAYIGTMPAYIKINEAGTYRVTAGIAIRGTANTSIEVEIFRQNSSLDVPATSSWITWPTTGYHDVEALSTVLSLNNSQFFNGNISGYMECAVNDYIALCSRVLSNSTNAQKVVSINLNVERIK